MRESNFFIFALCTVSITKEVTKELTSRKIGLRKFLIFPHRGARHDAASVEITEFTLTTNHFLTMISIFPDSYTLILFQEMFSVES